MKQLLYILAGDENLKEELEYAGIMTETIYLLTIEKDSPEEISIRDNLREILKQKMGAS